ncbi:hypothetical protein CAPTEDRAFT_158959 [Capitella teleta]|uniref:Myosin tail domain-containing protein n=1 Tax=Capitella teleta TaxID=283909 RepID=R7TV29_CAPTE|nr:hypothetical protein CAPTEDRAFT_158959 [Capitella teleta]|eukprot:ELT94855.1 hypothetical protein CAPTEDRAFT_158959 [Capitella teleta]
MRSELVALNEEIDKQRKQSSPVDADLKAVQVELQGRTRELSDVRHAYSKQKKLIAEMTGELDHTRSRAEQYEAEVKKVRGRVEELKQDLATAEDDVDQQTHQVRKLQRSNEELQQQVEGLQVQLQHMTTRLRRSSNPLLSSRASSLKSFDGLLDSDHEGSTHGAS